VKGPLSGTRAWVAQRVSALYMLCFIVYLLIHFAISAPHSYEAWKNWFAHAEVAVAVMLFFVGLLLHTWVGVRDVVLDYVHPIAVRSILLVLLAISQIAIGLWILTINSGLR
jgi:succinate dehydrogenase / fumarate reductase, membrane anchor subunit